MTKQAQLLDVIPVLSPFPLPRPSPSFARVHVEFFFFNPSATASCEEFGIEYKKCRIKQETALPPSYPLILYLQARDSPALLSFFFSYQLFRVKN